MSGNPSKKIHLIGIGGIGMSGLARIYLAKGHAVQGSDVKRSPILSELEAMGARVYIGHDAAHVKGQDIVIYSTAVKETHPERAAAVELGIKVLHRSEALAALCAGKRTIAVTGTHGKTTTTGLIGMVLKEAGRDPSIVVGGIVKSFGGNACLGGGAEIVIEADESDSSFLRFSPDIAVITNAEEEHMDHFGTVEKIEAAYRKFILRLSKDGLLLGCGEDARVAGWVKEELRPAKAYGFHVSRDRIYATDILECPEGRKGVSFYAWDGYDLLGRVELQLLGRHNVLNALAAVGVGLRLNIPFSIIANALSRYEGTGRRFDVRYEDPQVMVVDDYAHHPTEIQKTLLAARSLGHRRNLVLFQPHRYSRTESFMKEFGMSFESADKIVITDIYAASEAPVEGVSGRAVAEAIRSTGHQDVSFVERNRLTRFAQDQIRPGDLIITMGAGDITEVSAELASFLRNRSLSLKTLNQDAGSDLGRIRGKVAFEEPLSRHTTLRVGGPAQIWVEPQDAEDLKLVLKICREQSLKLHLFGAGSNLLAPDEGLRGVVVGLGSPYFREVSLREGRVVARAGVPNSLFIQFALENGLGGCEFLTGIPGNVGGAIAMNAGSHGQSVQEILESTRLMAFSGEEREYLSREIPFGYRDSGIRRRVILEGTFFLPKLPREICQRKLDEYREYRQRTQDLQHPSAGCMFKNPLQHGASSGKLIEDAGFKGRRIGNAQVSPIHANFIINLGGATARDVIQLMDEVQRGVREKYQIDLESEVKIL